MIFSPVANLIHQPLSHEYVGRFKLYIVWGQNCIYVLGTFFFVKAFVARELEYCRLPRESRIAYIVCTVGLHSSLAFMTLKLYVLISNKWYIARDDFTLG